MEQGTTYVGLDVSKRMHAIAVRWRGRAEPEERSMPNEPRAISRWARRMKREAPGAVVCAYKAGPTGYALQRQLRGLGLDCRVIAPSLIPHSGKKRRLLSRRLTTPISGREAAGESPL
ncbi:MAG: hypothetical protein ACREI8_06370 [Myxococcota bacterium]